MMGDGNDRKETSEFVVDFVKTEVVPRLPVPRAVLLVGSHAEGNANAASDIDLIVVTGEASSKFRVRKQEFEVDGRVVGVTYVAPEQLRRCIQRLDLLYRTGRYVTDALATRVPEAVVVYDTGIGQALISEANGYQPSARTLHEIARVCLTCYQDVMGSIDAHDPETAILMARQAANIAVDCFLLNRGFRSLKPKWHLRRLKKAGANRVLGRYRRVLGFDEPAGQMRAAFVFAELDRLVCEVLQIGDIREFERSPLWR